MSWIVAAPKPWRSDAAEDHSRGPVANVSQAPAHIRKRVEIFLPVRSSCSIIAVDVDGHDLQLKCHWLGRFTAGWWTSCC